MTTNNEKVSKTDKEDEDKCSFNASSERAFTCANTRKVCEL